MNIASGSREVKRFYDETGWRVRGGASVDHELFGTTEDGPIRQELHRVHTERIISALSRAGESLNLLECGCGGNPEKMFLHLCREYTGVDFSDTGLDMARNSFAGAGVPHNFRAADVCALPFADGSFDAVYSAHMVYHIEDTKAQSAALQELVRVVRTGGIVVVVAANPRPLAFPFRFVKRLLADTPVVGPLLNRLRPKPPLPYQPMSIGWMRRRLGRASSVEVLGGGMPPTSFYRNVTEFNGVGRLFWRVIRWIDLGFPRASAWLGNYVILICTKTST
jgi:ubiquinone/menaquinone biosynthesis C-methylase UbiE